MPLDVAPDRWQGGVQALPLRREHAHELAPPGQQGAQLLGLGVGQRARCGLHHLGEAREHLGVEGVGLGQLANGAGEVAHLARIDHRHRQPSLRQGRDQGHFAPAGGFQDDEGRGQRPEASDEVGDAALIVRGDPLPGGRAHGDIQLRFGDVNPNVAGEGLHDLFLPVSTWPVLVRCGLQRPRNCSGSREERARRPALSDGLARPKEDRPAVSIGSST
jgi:hypothetical protein